MKCVGGARGPCVRCHKARRTCERPQSSKRLNQGAGQAKATPIDHGPTGQQDNFRTFSPDTGNSFRHQQYRRTSIRHNSSHVSRSAYEAPSEWVPPTPDSHAVYQSSGALELPSIYSTSPFSVVVEHEDPAVCATPPSQHQRQRTPVWSPNNPTAQEESFRPIEPLSQRDLTQLLSM